MVSMSGRRLARRNSLTTSGWLMTPYSHSLVYGTRGNRPMGRSEEHTSELQSLRHLVCRRVLPSFPHDALPIYARSETVLEKPAYRDSFKKRRCLIPADGFYEWKKVGKEKQPYNFGMADDSIFAFTGIWDTWKSPDGKIGRAHV